MKSINFIKIGQKIKNLLLLTGILFVFGCPAIEDSEVYAYTFNNKTEYKLKIHFGVDNYDPNYTGIFTIELPANTLIENVRNFELDQKTNPVEQLLKNSYTIFDEQIRVYRNDSLLITWLPPPLLWRKRKSFLQH